ncbi:putative uncharacterized protein DDB_G0271982 [Belonocnema kinseyi]|uniref:putative uncharacterized protein DDB_G0271982 n=1 Tax=Belonocnema kinseyi TaxID=2817044 RepID=UPI00143CEC6F|nr:putative uncharacterized protein DDB_G0271982 [Belonocnema kinseyi]
MSSMREKDKESKKREMKILRNEQKREREKELARERALEEKMKVEREKREKEERRGKEKERKQERRREKEMKRGEKQTWRNERRTLVPIRGLRCRLETVWVCVYANDEGVVASELWGFEGETQESQPLFGFK